MADPHNPVQLSKACRALLAAIPTLTEPESQRQLAERLACNVVTVNRAVAKLVAAGFIERRRQDAGWQAHRPDELVATPAGLAYTELHSGSRALQGSKSKARPLPDELIQLRSAMRAAGLTAGFGNLYPEVEAELVARVRALGVVRLVREAALQTWGTVRHVAAYLARWRAIRAPRPVHCAFHPGQPPRGCPECAQVKAQAVRMPAWVRAQFSGRGRPPLPHVVMSA